MLSLLQLGENPRLFTFALEPAQRVLEGFIFLDVDQRHIWLVPPSRPRSTRRRDAGQLFRLDRRVECVKRGRPSEVAARLFMMDFLAPKDATLEGL